MTSIAVLKYSRSCVIRLSLSVHMCTQNTFSEAPFPSTNTLLPIPRMLVIANEKVSHVVTPVSKRIMCCCEGGPWNHHSKSSSTRAPTPAASPPLRAVYSSSTTLSFACSSASFSAFLSASFAPTATTTHTHTHTQTLTPSLALSDRKLQTHTFQVQASQRVQKYLRRRNLPNTSTIPSEECGKQQRLQWPRLYL